jgi:hypothetical protein
MRREDTVDNVIRSALRASVQTEEPSAKVRDSLLASATANDMPRSALGRPFRQSPVICRNATSGQ